MAESLFSHWNVAKIFAHLWRWEMLEAGLPLSVSYQQVYKECRLLRLCAILLEDELCFPRANLHGAWLCAHFCGWGIWEIQM